MAEIKLVLFDMDGVIFEGNNFWLDLHEEFGTREQGIHLANEHINSDYSLLTKLVLNGLWKGKPADIYWKLINERVYHRGIDKVFEFLKNMDIKSAIISSGPWHMAKRAQDELGIDMIYANRLKFKHDRIINKIDIMVPDSKKAHVGQRVMKSLKVSSSNTMFVGDSDSDVPLAEIVGTSIAYNSDSEKLKNVSTYQLNRGKLPGIIDIIKEGKAS